MTPESQSPLFSRACTGVGSPLHVHIEHTRAHTHIPEDKSGIVHSETHCNMSTVILPLLKPLGPNTAHLLTARLSKALSPGEDCFYTRLFPQISEGFMPKCMGER